MDEKDLGKFEVETKEQAVEKKRVHPHLGLPVVRFYQADDAADAPGAWYASMNGTADVKLHEVDSKFLHDLAERLCGKKA